MKRINRIEKYSDKKVYVKFLDGSSCLRNLYKRKRLDIEFICQNKTLYQLNWNSNTDSYDFHEIDELTKKLIEEDELKDEDRNKISISQIKSIESDVEYVDYIKHPKHSEEETIKNCIENDIPVMLVGPAGSGKNFTLQKIADDLELDFYFTNSIQQEYKITGFIDAGGEYHETEFYKAFKNGGLFFLDELDASIPEVLVLLNAAIANRYFEFPNGRIEAHEDFRVVAAGNTVGSGADDRYTGRMVIDQSTLDRFAIIEFNYERDIELSIVKGNKSLVDFVRELREHASSYGIRATFSYRCLTMVKDLEKAGLDLKKILKIAVFKGMDQDTINSFSLPYGHDRYHRALEELQAA